MLGGNLKAKLEERSAVGRAHFVARLHVGNRPRRPIFSILAAARLKSRCSLVRGEHDRRSVFISRAVHFEEAAEFVKDKVVCWIVVRAGARLDDELHRHRWVFDDAARTRLPVAGEVPSNPAEAHRLAKGLDLRQVAGHLGIAAPKSLYLGEDAQRRDAAELKAQKARKAQGRPQRDNALVVGKGAADELVERVVAGRPKRDSFLLENEPVGRRVGARHFVAHREEVALASVVVGKAALGREEDEAVEGDGYSQVERKENRGVGPPGDARRVNESGGQLVAIYEAAHCRYRYVVSPHPRIPAHDLVVAL